MLGYVFWHWKTNSLPDDQYEARLRDFHHSMAQHPPHGFRQSAAYAISGAAWAANGAPAYEDWYLVDNSAALDSINSGAISAPRREPHDEVAGFVVGGTAGIYQLRHGEPLGSQAAYAYWLAKPNGVTWEAFIGQFENALSSVAHTLWERYMVLGPTPSIVLHTAQAIDLPSDVIRAAVLLRVVV
jgi:hypothetical protein